MHRHLLCDQMEGVNIRIHKPEFRVESDFGTASDLWENDAAETARVGFRQHFVEQEALCDSLQSDKCGMRAMATLLCTSRGVKIQHASLAMT